MTNWLLGLIIAIIFPFPGTMFLYLIASVIIFICIRLYEEISNL